MTWALPGLLALSLGQAAQAQSQPTPVDGVIVSPPARAGAGPAACAPADYACLGAALKAAAAHARPAAPVPLGDAVSADVPTRVGTFSQAAVAQRLGPNLGRAATPWRPTSATNASPILAGRPTR
ncbi:hypothetical protein [Caulobacter soli]|uniref:hypothetical protein n=1 Tax=Caulobacter soli TaxID=2708539 RepID=UPI0013EDFEC5|nr:hypothetical protein [Caulobacter soli]